MPSSDLSSMGTVKYYKGFLNHAFALQTINAQKNQDLLFRISDSKKFDFKSYNSDNTATDLIEFGKNSGIRTHVDFTANEPVQMNDTLSVSGNAILDGSTTDVSGNLTVSGSANITTTGNTTVNGTFTASSNVNIDGDLSVSGTATFDNNVTIQNATVLQGTLSVLENIEFSSTLTVVNNATISGTLSVAGETIINNDLTVQGNITINSSLYASDLNITNDLSLGNKAYIGDVVTIQKLSNNAAFSHTSVNGTLNSIAIYQNSAGNTYIGGNSVYLKNTNMVVGQNVITISQPTNISNTLSVTNDVTIEGNLSVLSTSTFNSTVSVVGNLSVGGESTFNNNITVATDKTLNVLGTSSVENLVVNSGTITNLTVTNDAVMNSVSITNGNVTQLSVTGLTYVRNLQVANTAEFNSGVEITGTLSVASKSTFNSDVTISGNLSIASNKSIFLDTGASFILKGPSDVMDNGNYADDFSIREENGTFQMEMVHVETDTIHYANDENFVSKSTIQFNSQDITLKGSENVILETENSVTGKVEVKQQLSVSNKVYFMDTLSVSGVALLNDTVNIGTVTEVGATLSHTSQFSSVGYAIAQDTDGTVRLNAPSGQTVQIKNNNNSVIFEVSGNSVIANKGVFVNDTLSVSGLSYFNSNLTVSGDLLLTNDSTILSDVTIQGKTTVNGDSTFNCPVTFHGLVTSNCQTIHNGPLTVNCAATFESTLSISGNTHIDGILSVSNNVFVSGDLSVTGSVYAGSAIIETNSDVVSFKHSSATYTALSQNSVGDVDIKSSTITKLDIGSDNIVSITSNCVLFTKNVVIQQDLSVGDKLVVTNSATIGSLDIITNAGHAGVGYSGLAFNSLGFIQNSVGDTTINGANSVELKINNQTKVLVSDDVVTISTNSTTVQNLTANCNVLITGQLSVGGDCTFDSGMNINGTLSVQDNIHVTGTLTVNSAATLNGNTVISNSLTVNGDVFLNGDLIVRGTTTTVEIESTEVTFDDNAIILAANCDPSGWGDLFNDESGLYVYNSSVGFVYKHNNNPGWQTKGSDLGIDKDQKLFFSQESDVSDPKGWSIELDYSTDNGASSSSPDMVFKYYSGSGTSVTKLRITSFDADNDYDDEDWS